MKTEPPALHPPLDKILQSEPDLGNEIAEIELDGWTEVDLVVSLKFPFRKDYRQEFPALGFYRNPDPHYSLTDSYSANREAVDAPIRKQNRRLS